MDYALRCPVALRSQLFACVVMAGAFLISTFFPQMLYAATFIIPAGDVPALIRAINTANANSEADTLILAAGVYSLTRSDNETEGQNGLPSITSPITIQGAGADLTSIVRDAEAPFFRIMHVGAAGVLSLNGLTVAGGSLDDETGGDGFKGGGIRSVGFLNLNHCTIRDHGQRGFPGGGGIVNQGGVVVMTQCEVYNNAEGDGCGAGLFSRNGVVTIAQSTIRENHAYEDSNGGGLCAEGGNLWLLQSVVRDNTTAGGGGGIFNLGSMHIAESTVSGNIIDNFFPGGGIWNRGELTVTNSTVSHNRTRFASFGGGGLFNWGQLGLRGSTVTENQTAFEDDGDPARGGGILSLGGTVTLEQTIVAGNTIQEVSGDETPIRTSPSDCAGPTTSLGYNVVGRGAGCPRDGAGDRAVAPDRVFTQVLGPLQLNGGPTETHAPLSGSPAIDLMPEDICQLSRDQRGMPRPEDGDADGDLACDAGAVELRSGCQAQFGEAPGFRLCEETATTCQFNAVTDGGTCADMCRNFGARCLGALDSEGSSCMALPDSNDTCETPRQTEICICER